MPRLNRRGDIGAGVGGLKVSINRHVIAEPAGESEWVTDDELVYVHHVGRGRIMAGSRVVYEGGANALRAGGGLIAWSVRERDTAGIERWVTRFSDGRAEMFHVVIAGIGPDGTPHVTVDGLTHGVHAAAFQALPDGKWTAIRFGDYRPVDGPGVLPVALPEGRIYGLRRTHDDRFVIYSTDDGRIRVQQRDDVTKGYFLRDSAGNIIRSDAFRPDIVVLPDGTMKVTYATTEGEIPEHVKDALVKPSQLVEDMRTPVQPPPPPPPDPPPPPEPPVPTIPNRLDVVRRVRAQYPTPLGSTHPQFLLDVAGEMEKETGLNCGLLRKPGGTVITLPDGTTVSQDFLTFWLPDGVWGLDILADGEGAATPVWGSPEQFDGARFYDVIPGTPNPPPPPPPGEIDPKVKAYVEAAITASEARLTQLITQHAEHQGSVITDLIRRVTNLENADGPEPTIPKDYVRVSDFSVPANSPPGTKPKRRVRVPLTFQSPLTGTIEDVK